MVRVSLRSEFLNFGTIDISSWIILWCGRHCRIFNSIPDLDLQDVVRTLPYPCDNQKYLQTLPNASPSGIAPSVQTTDLDTFNGECINVYSISFPHKLTGQLGNYSEICEEPVSFYHVFQNWFKGYMMLWISFSLKLALKYTIVATDYSAWWSFEHI